LAVILLLYVASGLVFSNRAVIAYGFLSGNWRTAGEMSLTGERLLLALNPAATEFGSAFGNYSEYLNRSGALPALGETYVRGLTTPIPGFLYPGDKPQQAAYEFRDRFFPGLASQGAIAGTAYSSILESFVNFGPAGALFVYLIVGLGLGFAERGRWRAGRAGVHLLYLMLAVQAVAFHRSDLSSVIAATVIAGFIVVTYLTLRALSVALGATLLPTPAGGRGDHGTSQPGLEETA
jgi:hypothetical protein